VHKLEKGEYKLQKDEPVWLTELELGIGREKGTYQGITREWLYWYDRQEKRYPTPEERIQQAQQRTKLLEDRLRSLGVDPNDLRSSIWHGLPY
jgi:hypothetical protein